MKAIVTKSIIISIIIVIVLIEDTGKAIIIDWDKNDYAKKSYAKVVIPLDKEDKIMPIRLYAAKNEYFHLILTLVASKKHNISVELKGDKFFKPKIYQIISAPLANKRFSPDVLQPISGRITIGPGNTDIWIALHTAPESQTGTYDGQIWLQGDDKIIRVPLQIRVWKFSLAGDLPITIESALQNKQDQLSRYQVKTAAQFKEITQSYQAFLRPYKINALAGAYPHPRLQQFKGISPAEQLKEHYANVTYILENLGYKSFTVGRVRGITRATTDLEGFSREAQEFYAEEMHFLRERGWENRMEIVSFDEPSPEFIPIVAKANEIIRKAAPGVKIDIHYEPDPRLFGLIDIWTAYAGRINWENLAAARLRGDKIRLYYNQFHGLDYPPVYQRVLGWILFQYKFDGYTFWGGNYWKDDPWTTASQHRGSWFYPNPSNGMPWPSVRLEALRDGFQDYQYFEKFFMSYQKGKISKEDYEAVSRALEDVTSNFQDLKAMKVKTFTMELMDQVHQRIGAALDRAL
jgi:hypothetical protein